MVYKNIISTSDCETIIKRKFNITDFKVINYEIDYISDEKLGFLGNHCRLKIEVLLENKIIIAPFFLKVKLDETNPMFNMMENTKVFEREIFYLSLVSDNNNFITETEWIPKMYLARQNLFVLEDMSTLGFVPPKNTKIGNIDYKHMKVLFEALAKMHAFSIILEERKTSETGKVFRINEHYNDMLMEVLLTDDKRNPLGIKWTEQGLDVSQKLTEILPGNNCLSPEKYKQLLKEQFKKMIELFKPSKKYRNVLCHGDLWLNNFFCTYKNDNEQEPEKCCIFDFQLMRYLPPMHDIQFCLYVNTTIEFRQQYSDRLVHFYYQELSKNLKSANLDIANYYTWDQYIESGIEFIKASKIIAFCYKTVHFIDKDSWQKFLVDMNFLNDFVYINRSKHVLDLCKKNNSYRSALTEIMIEVRDMFINDNKN